MSQREIRREAPAPADGSPNAPSNRYGVGIRRVGCKVTVALTADNEYLAIELFDRLVASVRAGYLHLNVSGQSALLNKEGSFKGRPKGRS